MSEGRGCASTSGRSLRAIPNGASAKSSRPSRSRYGDTRLRDCPGRPTATRRSDVEADVEDVAVLDDVVLRLEPLQPLPRGLGVRPGADEVVPADHLAADEAARNIRMNRARRLDRGRAAPQRPRPRLLLAGGEELDLVERVLQAPDDLLERRR